ncbi:MAG: hypothetical protein HYS21_08930 [Deltaproteobacteria bacterium]|nr:hypothetical protein [Deltaproteobacteria bacterium]
MRPLKSVLVVLCSVLILLISLNDATAKDNVNKAKEFMQANMYPAAIALLEKEVFGIDGDLSKGNPRNYEAQYLLGLCYVRIGKLNSADERFASAIQLKSDYGRKISKDLKNIGIDAIKQGQLKTALSIFDRALFYEPAIIGETVRELIALGNGYIGGERSARADIAFEASVSINSDSESEACAKQYAAGLEADDKTAITILPFKSYCPSFNRMAGEKLVFIARKNAMAGNDSEKVKYKKFAVQYLGESAVNDLLPEVVVHDPGEYIFELKAGEMTPYWIDFPDGVRGGYQIYYRQGSDFLRLYENGKEVEMDTPYFGKSEKFKIKAINDVYVKMVVQ